MKYTMKKDMLTAREREIVNLSTSIAAGCQPCTKYHVKKCMEAGVSNALIIDVTEKTKQICFQAIEIMREKVFTTLGIGQNREISTHLGMDSKTEILIGLAASYSMNSTILFEMFLNHVITQEIGEQKISELIEIKKFIHDKAKAHVDMLCTKRGVDRPSGVNKDCDTGCGC
jgi:AhpD family alkylhydroperoxidase